MEDPMLRPLTLVAALLVGCTEPIEPGTETVSAEWDVDMFTLYPSPTIERFDTLDGARQLDGMTLAVDHTSVMTIEVENGGPAPLSTDDYVAHFYFNTLMQLGAVDDEDPPAEGEGPPFLGPGSFEAMVSVDLPAGDQDPETVGTVHQETFTEDFQFEADYDWTETPTYLEAMIGEEPITVVVGGFSEMFVEWAEGTDETAFLFAGNTALRYSGTLTITYAYSAAE